MQLVKIENLYRNIFTQVPVTGAEPIQDYHVPRNWERKKAHGLVKNKNHFSQDPQAQIQSIIHSRTIHLIVIVMNLQGP